MDELESRLEHQLSGLGRVPLADPVPVDDLRRRARHVRVGRALTSVVATMTAVVVITAFVVAARQDRPPTSRTSCVAAPDFILGAIGAVVLSSSLAPTAPAIPCPRRSPRPWPMCPACRS
jgi:hypothetical protein